jgi:hypothetical protein
VAPSFDPESELSEAVQQLNRYFHECREPLKTDCLSFWRKNKERFPYLVKIVKRYLSSPVGSVESERLFSTASYVVNKHRTLLSVENLQRLLMLHHNVSLYNFDY